MREYADDEGNTETTTVLRMQVGGPGRPTAAGRAIHWHADPAVRVEFVSTDADRQMIPYVKVTRADGRTTEYIAEGAPAGSAPAGVHRVMDCIDCHNARATASRRRRRRPSTPRSPSGRLSARLPFIRREAVRLLKAEQATEQAALDAIARELREVYPAAAVAAVQDVYRTNVFPAMKVPRAYPDNIGHMTSNGCFRCHDGSHTAKDGRHQRRLRVLPRAGRGAAGADDRGAFGQLTGPHADRARAVRRTSTVWRTDQHCRGVGSRVS